MSIIEWIAEHDFVRDLLKDAGLVALGAILTIAGAAIQEVFARRRGIEQRKETLEDAKRDSSEAAAREAHKVLTRILNAATAEASSLGPGSGLKFNVDDFNETLAQTQLIADEVPRTLIEKALQSSRGVGPAVAIDDIEGPPHRVQRKLLSAANKVLTAYIRRENELPRTQIDFIEQTHAIVDATWNSMIAGGEAQEV